MGISEDQFSRWAQGPSQAETDRCETTVRRITEAIRPHYGSRVRIFAQGSYANRTNVRQDSDVDVVVRDNNTYFGDLTQMGAEARARYDREWTPADHTFDQFKTQVHRLLTGSFGPRVERRNKCIFVPETASGVNGDVVPCFVHKRFGVQGQVLAEGIKFLSDDSHEFDSFPEQHYANGVAKHDRTRRMFKRLVRILKNIRGELVDRGTLAEDAISSFFIECFVYNAPDSAFSATTYSAASKQVIESLWEATGSAAPRNLVEVNGLKWLFAEGRTPEQARAFLQAAYTFLGH